MVSYSDYTTCVGFVVAVVVVYIYDDVYMYKWMVYVCVYMACIYRVGKERGWDMLGDI